MLCRWLNNLHIIQYQAGTYPLLHHSFFHGRWTAIRTKLFHRRHLFQYVLNTFSGMLSRKLSSCNPPSLVGFVAQTLIVRCATISSAQDFTIPILAGPYINNRWRCCDSLIRLVESAMPSVYCIRVPSRQLDLYGSMIHESCAATTILLSWNVSIPVKLRHKTMLSNGNHNYSHRFGYMRGAPDASIRVVSRIRRIFLSTLTTSHTTVQVSYQHDWDAVNVVWE